MTGKGKEIALWAISHLPTTVEAAAEPERQRVRKEVEPQLIFLMLCLCPRGLSCRHGISVWLCAERRPHETRDAATELRAEASKCWHGMACRTGTATICAKLYWSRSSRTVAPTRPCRPPDTAST